MNDVYKNIEEYNSNKQWKIVIVFDDMVPDMLSHKKFNQTVTKLFIRGRKLNISLLFITQSYSTVPRNILHSTHNFLVTTSSKREIHQISFNHSSDVDVQDFINLFKNILQNHIHF